MNASFKTNPHRIWELTWRAVQTAAVEQAVLLVEEELKGCNCK
jgi:hypothetical protein